MERGGRARVAAWLIACCTLLFVLIVVGGITRLTRSGLSIVEWQQIIGTLPPLNEAQWLTTFEKYKLTPEYKQVNFGLSLAAFKGIFWWEYTHRLLGRLLGLVFFVPYAWFLLRRGLDRTNAWKLAGVLVLGAAQGKIAQRLAGTGIHALLGQQAAPFVMEDEDRDEIARFLDTLDDSVFTSAGRDTWKLRMFYKPADVITYLISRGVTHRTFSNYQ